MLLLHRSQLSDCLQAYLVPPGRWLLPHLMAVLLKVLQKVSVAIVTRITVRGPTTHDPCLTLPMTPFCRGPMHCLADHAIVASFQQIPNLPHTRY